MSRHGRRFAVWRRSSSKKRAFGDLRGDSRRASPIQPCELFLLLALKALFHSWTMMFAAVTFSVKQQCFEISCSSKYNLRDDPGVLTTCWAFQTVGNWGPEVSVPLSLWLSPASKPSGSVVPNLRRCVDFWHNEQDPTSEFC